MPNTKPNYCPNCGKDTASSDIFCANCGHRLINKKPRGNAGKVSKEHNVPENVEEVIIPKPVEASTSRTLHFSFRKLWLKWFAWSFLAGFILFYISIFSSDGDQPSVIETFLGAVMVGVILGGMISIVGAIVHKHFYLKKHPELKPQLDDDGIPDESLNGIKGWLAFFVVGLVISVLADALILFVFIAAYGQYIDAGSGTLIWYEIISTTTLLGLVIWALILVFQRKKMAVTVIIVMLSVSALVAMIDAGISSNNSQQVNTTSESTTSNPSSSRALLAAIIWIPYFYKSKRVKATLVK